MNVESRIRYAFINTNAGDIYKADSQICNLEASSIREWAQRTISLLAKHHLNATFHPLHLTLLTIRL